MGMVPDQSHPRSATIPTPNPKNHHDKCGHREGRGRVMANPSPRLSGRLTL